MPLSLMFELHPERILCRVAASGVPPENPGPRQAMAARDYAAGKPQQRDNKLSPVLHADKLGQVRLCAEGKCAPGVLV